MSSGATGCVLEFSLSGFSLNPETIGDTRYRQAIFEGSRHSSESGAPAVPFAEAVVAVPVDGPVGASLAGADSYREFTAVRLPPNPTWAPGEDGGREIFPEGPAYSESGERPAALFEASEPEWAGPYRVVRIRVNPVQYSAATGGLKVYSKIAVSVSFGGRAPGTAKVAALPDEQVYSRMLLNFTTARTWRKARAETPARLARRARTGSWYRVRLGAEGLYKVTGSFLAGHGIDLAGVDPATVKVCNNGGQPVPARPGDARPDSLVENPIACTGFEDGRFDPGDYFVFYGTGTARWDYNGREKGFRHAVNPFSETNVYWIGFNDGRPGRRIQTDAFPAGSAEISDTFLDHVFIQKDSENPLRGGMFWATHGFDEASSEWAAEFQAPDAVPGDTVFFRVRIKGDDDTFASHRLTLSLNGNPLGSVTASSNAVSTTPLVHPRGLAAGRNTLEFRYASSIRFSKAYLGWVEADFNRRLNAAEGALKFYSPGRPGLHGYRLTGLGPNPTVWDVTDPSFLRGLAVVQEGDAWIAADMQETRFARSYFAHNGTDFLTPPAPEADRDFTDFRDPSNEGELLIVSHRDFWDAAERYKRFKEESDSLSVFLADVDEVYDQFSGGLLDPGAIRDFVKTAFETWRKPPAYLMLFGDGDYDYRNLESDGDKNWIPPYERDAWAVLDARATDDWFTYVSGNDERMDLSVGRFPVQTAEEANAFVDKLIRYQSEPERGDWRTVVTLVSDDEVNLQNLREREHVTDTERLDTEVLPPEFNRKKIYMTEYPEEIRMRRMKPKATDALVSQINAGTLIVNYTGHANRGVWATEWLFQHQSEFPKIDNGYRLPLFYAATCEWGLFDDPGSQHFAEDLLVAPGRGAAAVIAATRFCFSGYNSALNRECLREMLGDPFAVMRLGDALRLGKWATADGLTNNEKYVILGDPTMRLAVPRRKLVFTGMEPDTFKALSLVRVKGEVWEGESVWEEFQGKILLRAEDSKKSVKYTTAALRDTLRYALPGNTLFRGESAVESGRFEAEFIVPKDLSYGGLEGRLSGYAWNETTDGFGSRDDVVTGGSTVLDDGEGPEIRLSFSGRGRAAPGEMAPEDAELEVELEDIGSGINLTGEIGHTITVSVDGRPAEDLGERFRYDTGSHVKGRTSYSLDGLGRGAHEALFKAWDNANNSSTEVLEFRVVPAGSLVLEKVLAYPNPMSRETNFTFEVSEASEAEIRVYTVDGRMVQKLENLAADPGFNAVPWEGRDFAGDGLPNGVYLYKVTVRARLQGRDAEASEIGKLIVMQ